MFKNMSRKERIQLLLCAVAVVIIIFGLMFMLTAAKLVSIFPAFYSIKHILVQYIIVIGTMALGIMTFSNVSARIDDTKKRNILTIIITAFSTVLTLPLLYVFIALFPAMHGKIGPVGEIMVKDVALDFQAIFPSHGVQYLIYSLGVVMAIVFLAFPLITGILTVKGKTIVIGKGGIKIAPLQVAKEDDAA